MDIQQLQQYGRYLQYAVLGIGGISIVIFLLISISEGRAEIARLRKAKAPFAHIAKEVVYSVRYFLIGAALLGLASMALSQPSA